MFRASFVNVLLVSKAGGISMDIFVVSPSEAAVEACRVSALRDSCLGMPCSAIMMMFHLNMARIWAVPISTVATTKEKNPIS